MDQFNRRDAIKKTSAVGLAALAPAPAEAAPDQEAAPARKKDRDFVIEAGMTSKEADCWELIAQAAGAFFELPELHPMDKQEVASAIHVIQNKLLSRPTYRKYLEIAKAARK